MESTTDREFIRRAVELADLNAVRLALYHNTQDPEVGSLPVPASMSEDERALLVDKAVAWLAEHAGPTSLDEPEEAALRAMLDMAAGETVGDVEFEARRDLPSFKPFPWAAEWTTKAPPIPEDFQVVVVGSGLSGIAMAVQLQLLGIPYIVIDRRPEPGGTWTINRYPDVRVDTISITYEYSFEKNYPWTEYFARGPEVRDYVLYISKKNGVFENTRFDTELKAATFNEEQNKWVLDVETPGGSQKILANVVINAVGTYANPKLPAFAGQEAFQGEIFHPSRWPEDLDLTGKRVAVIGNGSTGVQMVAPIARDAEQEYVFQRTPQWISPRDKYGKPVEPEIRWLLDNFPGYWNWWRYSALSGLFNTHAYLLPDEEWRAKGGHFNALNDKMREDLTAYIKAETGNRADLVSRLIPDYAPFSRRPIVDNEWYRTLTLDNVELVTDEITSLTPTGIETADGSVREVDVIVMATGFEVQRYLWPAQYTGLGGIGLDEFWAKDGARAYKGMMIPNFPNMFTLYGPNSQPVSGGPSLPVWFVLWSSYAAKCIVAMLEQGKSRVDVTREAYDRYNEELDAASAKLILLHPEGAAEKNYYVNEHGRVQVNAPWYSPDYFKMCSAVDWDEVEIS